MLSQPLITFTCPSLRFVCFCYRKHFAKNTRKIVLKPKFFRISTKLFTVQMCPSQRKIFHRRWKNRIGKERKKGRLLFASLFPTQAKNASVCIYLKRGDAFVGGGVVDHVKE